MGVFDDIFPDLATTLTTALGDSGVTFLRVPATAYDPRSGTRSVSKPTDIPLDTAPAQAYRASQINGSLIQVGDFTITVAAQSVVLEDGTKVTPLPGAHTIVFGGNSFQIVTVQPVYSGQLVAVYIIQVRK